MIDRSASGQSLAPVHAQVESGRLRCFFDTIDEQNPVYRDAKVAASSGYTAIPVPPTYLFCLEMMDAERPYAFLDALQVDIGNVLHGEQQFKYFAPVVVGDRLTFRSQIGDIVDKKGGALTIVSVTTEVTNQHGKKVAEMLRGVVIRNQ